MVPGNFDCFGRRVRGSTSVFYRRRCCYCLRKTVNVGVRSTVPLVYSFRLQEMVRSNQTKRGKNITYVTKVRLHY